ncbi:ATP-binding protein [Microtetraspora sp. NBRC 16547]|uniref:ATP-binding protein n=1 Tax=Microtetraspora sp. NBRC 16547 TaxID=3030993 RepID=UPI0024A00674|nr:hypothetical protein Misp02_22550 [Microtetraspora sp. NBRC 16547]
MHAALPGGRGPVRRDVCTAGRAGRDARLADAYAVGRLQEELVKLARIPVPIVDEVGYIPFEPEAANVFFQLVSSRYERASLIVTSNKPFGKAHMFARTCARWSRKVTGSVTRAPLRLASRTGVRPLGPSWVRPRGVRSWSVRVVRSAGT